MSMTKRYLESLPADEQDAILGPPGSWMDAEYETVPQIFCKPDEWDDDAENEPDVELVPCDDCGAQVPVNTLWDGVCRKCADGWRYIAGLLERERKGEKQSNDAENEPTDEELAEWARALMEEEEVDKFTERDESPLVRPPGKCVTETDANGVEWKL